MPESQGLAQARPYCVFAHGWAYTLDFHIPLLESLFSDHPALMQKLDLFGLEQGYFQRPAGVYQWNGSDWVASTLPNAHPAIVGIGHSLGLAKLLEAQIEISHWLSLNGFSRFTAHERGQSGTPRKLVERMLTRLEQSPELVLEDFWARAQGSKSFPPEKCPLIAQANPSALSADLFGMIDLDLTETLRQIPAEQMMAVYSPTDPIVSKELSEDIFLPACLHELNAPHSGPLLSPRVYTPIVALALNRAIARTPNHAPTLRFDS